MHERRGKPVARGGARRGALLAVCSVLAAGLLGCARRPPRPPILFVTFHGLRADAVGALDGERGLTPRLDAFAGAASLSTRAVAASSAGAPALAALFTGLRPWQTQVLYDGMRLSRRFATLPSALAEAGYRTSGFTEEPALRRGGGFVHGFEVLQAQTLRARGEVERRLCGPQPGFLWAHYDLVSTGYHRHPELQPSSPVAVDAPPPKVTRADLERWSNPATPMTAAERAGAWALYASGVTDADAQVGALLDALRDCGHFDDALVVLVGDHGEAFGEGGRSGHGGGLGRAEIEVPLLLKLPARDGQPAALPVPASERISASRVFATVLAALELPVPPGVAPGLAIRDPGGAESELYRLNGENLFSLVDGGGQLVRAVRFAPADPEYFTARRALVEPAARAALLERSPKAVMNRLTRAFRQTLPYHDRGDVHLELQRWAAAAAPLPVAETPADPAEVARLGAALERAYFRFVAEELTPAEARRR